MEDNNNGLHFNQGVPVQRWRMGYARSLFGPEVTEVLAGAGYFRVAPLDETSVTE